MFHICTIYVIYMLDIYVSYRFNIYIYIWNWTPRYICKHVLCMKHICEDTYIVHICSGLHPYLWIKTENVELITRYNNLLPKGPHSLVPLMETLVTWRLYPDWAWPAQGVRRKVILRIMGNEVLWVLAVLVRSCCQILTPERAILTLQTVNWNILDSHALLMLCTSVC